MTPMGLFRHRDGRDAERFVMRQKLLAIGDDFWIEDEQGDRVYKVNGKAFRLRQTFVLEDTSGREVARIKERKLTVRDKIAIERDGAPDVTVHKALVGIRDRFAIDVRDSYGVEVAEGEDAALMLALTVAIDALTTRG